ncbi:hypothetical protein GA0115259_107827, partial [Streptomyces sp. MnatMP-M17]
MTRVIRSFLPLSAPLSRPLALPFPCRSLFLR